MAEADIHQQPTIIAYGGVGTGATFTSTIQNGSVVSISVDKSRFRIWRK